MASYYEFDAELYEYHRAHVLAWFEYVAALPRAVESLSEQICALRSHIELTGYDFSGAPGQARAAASDDRIAEGLDALAVLGAKWADAVHDFVRDYDAALEVCTPKNPDMHALWLHHVVGLTWADTAERMGLSVSRTRALAYDGIETAYLLMPHEWQ